MMSVLSLSAINAICRFNRFDWPRDRFDQFDRFFMMRPGMMIIGLIILVLVIVGIVFLIRALVRAGRNGKTPVVPPTINPDSKALQILDERLARGEISPEEYRQRKEELLK